MNKDKRFQAWSATFWSSILLTASFGCADVRSPPRDSPKSLAEAFGLRNSSPASQQAEFRQQLQSTQALVATCMRKAGFEYVPFIAPGNATLFGVVLPVGAEVTFKEKNGYGMADALEESRRALDAAVPGADPNRLIRSKLATADQIAYDRALNGLPTGKGNEQATGCFNEQFRPLEVSVSTREKMASLTRRIEADPQHRTIVKQWSICMKQNGFEVSRQRDVYDKLLIPKQVELMEAANAASVSLQTERPVIGASDVADFRVFEMKVARADAKCLPQAKLNRLHDVSLEYERGFLESNPDIGKK